MSSPRVSFLNIPGVTVIPTATLTNDIQTEGSKYSGNCGYKGYTSVRPCIIHKLFTNNLLIYKEDYGVKDTTTNKGIIKVHTLSWFLETKNKELERFFPETDLG